MKSIWKVFEFEEFHVLVGKNAVGPTGPYELQFTFCPSLGKTYNTAMRFGNPAELDSAFENANTEYVRDFGNYIMQTWPRAEDFIDVGSREVRDYHKYGDLYDIQFFPMPPRPFR